MTEDKQHKQSRTDTVTDGLLLLLSLLILGGAIQTLTNVMGW